MAQRRLFVSAAAAGLFASLSAATNPEFISGPGVIDAGMAPGMTIILR